MFEKKKDKLRLFIERYIQTSHYYENNGNLRVLNNASSVFSKARHVSRHENTMTPFFPFRESHVLLIPMARGGNEW